jgi:Xaa-Pro aminopeptidase
MSQPRGDAEGAKTAKPEDLGMTAEPTEPRPIAAWTRVLDKIEATLARQMASVEEPDTLVSDAKPPAKAPLQVLDDRLAQMQNRLEQADRDAAVTDAALRTDGEAYQHWTETMTATRRKLADWVARVG